MGKISKELRAELDKSWVDFVTNISEMHNKFNQVCFQFEDTLSKLKSAVNPHNLPYGYGDRK